MRYGQHFIEKTGEGILAFINPHGFLDNPTFRGMRWNLLKTFDKIYTIDLYGNSKKKETAPDGSKDENVFDIQQGVSINILVKTGKKKPNELGTVNHLDLYGKREAKYETLWKNSLSSLAFTPLPHKAPMYFMVQKDFELEEEYSKGFLVTELFETTNVGIVTSRDAFVIDDNKEVLRNRIKDFFALDAEALKKKYGLRENKSWKINEVKARSQGFDEKYLQPIAYRPFDTRWIYYDDDFLERSRREVMEHLMYKNLALNIARQCASDWRYSLVSEGLSEFNLTGTAGRYGSGYSFPLYLYPTGSNQQQQDLQGFGNLEGLPEDTPHRVPNLNSKLLEKITRGLGLAFEPEGGAQTLEGMTENNLCLSNSPEVRDEFKEGKTPTTFAPIHLLDYIYAVLHSPAYRKKYQEFLKIDFPRVPYPTDAETFWQLVQLGGELRHIHLLQSHKVEQYITTYPIDGDNVVSRKMTKNSPGYVPFQNDQTDTSKGGPEDTGRVWINDTQYFDGVPLAAWEFYIGSYQPAQKWLKDRQGRELGFEEILHYQKIIVALYETDRIMREIDKIALFK